MVISSRLQLLLKEVGIEEQSGFMGRSVSGGIFFVQQAPNQVREH